MFTRFVAFLLITCTISANFSKLFVFAGFEINKGYISATLCENRDRPWLHCNGRCYLMKKIKQAEDKEKNEERQIGKSLFQEAVTGLPAGFQFHSVLLAVLSTPYPHLTLPQHLAVIFQPPKTADFREGTNLCTSLTV